MQDTNISTSVDISHRFEGIISHLPGIMYRCGPERGYPLLWVGGQAEQTCGYTNRELLQDTRGAWSRLIHPEDITAATHAVQKALDAHISWQTDFRICRADGSTAWIKGFGGGIYDADGQVTALEGVFINMTSQMVEKEEWQLRAQEARDRNVRIVAATSDILETLQSLSVLSINASIEAARAGDAGRGFNVVAQEMNRLAARAEDTATAIRRATGSDRENTPNYFRNNAGKLSNTPHDPPPTAN